MASDLVRQLIDAGIHFGHRVSRWNPKMQPYIYGKRNMIHVIDIRETVKGLIRAKKLIAQKVSENGDVLFVGTKRQARHSIMDHATRVEMPWVAERWLGGTLTNFKTIRSRLARLEELEAEANDGRLQQYSKKHISRANRERRKIQRNLDGIRKMNRIPSVMVVIDVKREHNAVKEARKMGIPTICLIDTDSDPQFADIPIPGNDDSMRSIDAVLEHLANAVEIGKRARAERKPEQDRGGRGDRDNRPRRPRKEAPAVEKPADAPEAATAVAEPEQAPAEKPEAEKPAE